MEKIDRKAVALTIAGSDSSAGAGVQADIKSSAACGSFMANVITSITAQNTTGVSLIEEVSPAMIEAQLAAVLSDMNVTALKSGMMPSSECVDALVESIKAYDIKNVVVDPVMVSTSGATLISEAAVEAIVKKLFPLTLVVTPNVIEAAFISGVKIESRADFDAVAAVFKNLGVRYLLLKGGHVDGDVLVDVLYDCRSMESVEYSFPKIDSVNTHGTGCSLSASIAAFLSQGYDVYDSVERAEQFVHGAIERGVGVEYGAGHGPIAHFDYL